MLFPDHWEAANHGLEISEDQPCMGIYNIGNGSFKVRTFHLNDTTVDNPAYGQEKLLVIDSVQPSFIVSGINNLKHNDEIKGADIVHTSFSNSVIVPDKPYNYEIGNKKYTILAKGNNFIDPGISEFPGLKNYGHTTLR